MCSMVIIYYYYYWIIIIITDYYRIIDFWDIIHYLFYLK
jgi:hypothetical protein